MSARGTCPSCGGVVEFRFERAFVTTCTYCGSTVARTDRGLDDLGKRSDVVASESGLELFRKGALDGVPFTLMGRTVLAHPKGGSWSEWYAELESGAIAWLAEAQGVFTVMREVDAAGALEGVTFEALAPGSRVPLGGTDYVVTERSTRRTTASEGESQLVPAFDRDERFVDLATADGRVATIDFADRSSTLFVGRRVRLEDLGIAAREGRRDARGATTTGVACGNCGGPIVLAAPGATRRVTCAACGSLHAVEDGHFRFLETLDLAQPPAIHLGTKFLFEGTPWQIVGWMERSVTSEGVRYPWREFLAYEGRSGFRWLVESKGHWTWLTPAPTFARPMPTEAARTIDHEGRGYRLFAHDFATVDAIAGEFPWEVAIGERAEAFDYVCAPYVLSCEGDADEINWTRGVYVERDVVAKLFPGAHVGPAEGVGMAQPNPFRGIGKSLLRGYGAALALLFVLLALRPETTVLEEEHALSPPSAADDHASEGMVIVTKPFELRGSRRVSVGLLANPTGDAYADFVVDVLDARDVAVESFRAASFVKVDDDGDPAGLADGESTIGALEPGEYRLRIDTVTSSPAVDALRVRVREGGVGMAGWFALLFALTLLAVPFGILSLVFETRRRESSDFDVFGNRLAGSVGSASGGDDGASDDDSGGEE